MYDSSKQEQDALSTIGPEPGTIGKLGARRNGPGVKTVPSDLEVAANGTTGMDAAWKQDLNDKVAAARARRQAARQQSSEQNGSRQGEVLRPGQADSRTARVAAAVAARYAQAPSYSEYLATEVRTAMMAAIAAQEAANEAHAAAEAAAKQARAIQAALQAPEIVAPPVTPAVDAKLPSASTDAPRVDYAASGIPCRPAAETPARSTTARSAAESPSTPKISSDPMQDAMLEPATPLPAKLLAFPRELIAARKARPRHAEGPLRNESQEEPQLRIFEVEPESISQMPSPAPAATEWSSIRLDAYPTRYVEGSGSDEVSSTYPSHAYPSHANSARPASERRSPAHGNNDEQGAALRPHYAGNSTQPSYYALRDASAFLKVASLSDRLMAGIVDCALVAIAYLLFVLVFTTCTAHPPTGRPAVIGSAVLIGIFYVVYQFLFFSFSSGTPGMLYARIALCTFEDDNPSRDAMRKRIFALVLAAMPLGLGFLYALFDEDHLGWHDRMTRMYQRSYK